MKTGYKLLHGWEYENLDKKIDWLLSLTIAERYNQIVSLGDFLREARRRQDYSNVRRAFKSLQILKPK